MTPFLALLRARHVTAPTMLLYLYRTSDHAAFLPELQALAASDLKASPCAVATDNKLPDLRTLLADAGALAGQEIYVAGSPGSARSRRYRTPNPYRKRAGAMMRRAMGAPPDRWLSIRVRSALTSGIIWRPTATSQFETPSPLIRLGVVSRPATGRG